MEIAYAQALIRLLSKGMKPTEVVAAMRTNLEKMGRQALFPKIARAFARIVQRDRNKNGVVLTTARAHDQAHATREAHSLLSSLDVAAKDLMHDTDDSLIGGWRLEGREILVDASFKKQLLSLYNRTTQS